MDKKWVPWKVSLKGDLIINSEPVRLWWIDNPQAYNFSVKALLSC